MDCLPLLKLSVKLPLLTENTLLHCFWNFSRILEKFFANILHYNDNSKPIQEKRKTQHQLNNIYLSSITIILATTCLKQLAEVKVPWDMEWCAGLIHISLPKNCLSCKSLQSKQNYRIWNCFSKSTKDTLMLNQSKEVLKNICEKLYIFVELFGYISLSIKRSWQHLDWIYLFKYQKVLMTLMKEISRPECTIRAKYQGWSLCTRSSCSHRGDRWVH